MAVVLCLKESGAGSLRGGVTSDKEIVKVIAEAMKLTGLDLACEDSGSTFMLSRRVAVDRYSNEQQLCDHDGRDVFRSHEQTPGSRAPIVERK